jgi:hypothetical protein
MDALVWIILLLMFSDAVRGTVWARVLKPVDLNAKGTDSDNSASLKLRNTMIAVFAIAIVAAALINVGQAVKGTCKCNGCNMKNVTVAGKYRCSLLELSIISRLLARHFNERMCRRCCHHAGRANNQITLHMSNKHWYEQLAERSTKDFPPAYKKPGSRWEARGACVHFSVANIITHVYYN